MLVLRFPTPASKMPVSSQIDCQISDSFQPIDPVAPSAAITLEEKIERSVFVMKGYLRQGKHLVSAFSAGKDSSVATDIMLRAIREVVAEDGHCPQCAVLNSNTLIENPEMDRYSRSEITKLRAFVASHNLPVSVQIATPSRSNHYLLNIIGGRTVASVAEMGDSKCSDMLKVTTINRAKKDLFKQYGMDNVITIIGKRFDESGARGANMRARGETQHEAIKNEKGEWILSAIADFTLDDVFFYIGYARNHKVPSYSDFEAMMEIYRGGNDGGACELIIAMSGKSSNAGCGARFGCHLCLRTKDDKSMMNMIAQEQYAYMKPLNEFRNYIRAHHFNPAKRNWLARTVREDGSVTIAPNAYSPDFCVDLFKFALTIDQDEREAAAALGIQPRFELITPADVVHVELLWSRYGYQTRFRACEIAHDVWVKGMRFLVPTDQPMFTLADLPRVSMQVPFADAEFTSVVNGFRDPMLSLIDQESTVVKNGVIYTDCLTDDEMTIDDEGAELFFGFEWERVLKDYSEFTQNPTQVFHYFLRLGTISLYKGSHSEVDRMLRMASQIHRHGIRDVLHDPEALIGILTRRAGGVATAVSMEPIRQFELFAA